MLLKGCLITLRAGYVDGWSFEAARILVMASRKAPLDKRVISPAMIY